MPRVAKKETLAKLELDGYPTKLTLEYLQGLHRAQIQELAKRYGVRANLKTDEIIKQLVVKEEQNEPNIAAPTVKKGKVAQKAAGKKKVQHESEGPQPNGGEGSAQVVPEAGAPEINEASASNDNDTAATEATKSRPRRGRAAPYPAAKERETLKKSPKKAPAAAAEPPEEETVAQPTVKDVRRVRRLLVTLNAERVGMQRDVEETKSILAAAQRALDVATNDVKAISWRRELYERDILAQMKSKRSLWDGTPHLAPKDRKVWEGFVEANWELPRRARHQERMNELEALREEQGRDGDNEMSDKEEDNRGSERQALQPTTTQAMEEVNYDDIYV